MDPLSSLSVASSLVQLIDFAAKVVSGTYKIHKAISEEKGNNRDIKFITDNLRKLNNELGDSISRSVSLAPGASPDKDIIKLCEECDDVAKQLLSVLTKLDAKAGQGVWSSARQALLTLLNQDQLDRLQGRLDTFRQQISMHILVSLRHHLISSHHQHSQEKKETDSVLKDLRALSNTLLAHVNKNNILQRDLIRAINDTYWSQSTDNATFPTHDDSLVQLLTARDKTRLSERILSLLQYTEIQSRSEAISKAYKNTFEWIFEDQKSEANWDSFLQWLESGDSLYWITGKPGAGKSTLMKFLFEDERVRPLLKVWAGQKDLIVSSFYFWNSGTQIQMSLEGLTRTLLHSVLRQRPSIIPQVFPHRLEAWTLFGDDLYSQNTWSLFGNGRRPDEVLSWPELRAALQRLGHELHTEDSTRLVFFLDGLDEFAGEHADLIAFIKALISRNVKICISSRPWIVFEDAFRLLPSLRIEELTRRDIKIYVESKFDANSGFQARKVVEPEYAGQLVENVADKASGVFLWVYLATASLLTGLAGGERLSDLQKRLDALPSNLEKLFWNILNALDAFHFERASQLFQIIRASTVPLSVLGLSFADDDDPEALFRLKIEPLSPQEETARAEIMRRRLNVCCKGMIEPNSRSETSLATVPVGYLHRTVKDFLQKPENWDKLLKATDKAFNPQLRLSFAHAMNLKVLGSDKYSWDDLWDNLVCTLQHSMAVHPDGGESQFRLFTEVDKTIKQKTQHPPPLMQLLDMSGGGLVHQPPTEWTYFQRYVRQTETFLDCAVRLQLLPFVQESVRQSASSTFRRQSIDVTRLLYLVATSLSSYRSSGHTIITWETRYVDMARLFLESGANPNAKFNGETTWQVVARDFPRRGPQAVQDVGLLDLFLRHGAAPNAVDMSLSPKDVVIPKPRNTGKKLWSVLRFGR